jgi:voltage-gated potassium channel
MPASRFPVALGHARIAQLRHLAGRFFCVSILGYVLHSGRVTSDKIFATICVYLLVGFVWTYAYALLDEVQPGSFAASTETGRNDYVGRIMQLRYFSFATLTTLGYGDILPRSPTARTMAVLETVMGQIYLAVLVARLVGLHIVHGNADRPRDEDRPAA